MALNTRFPHNSSTPAETVWRFVTEPELVKRWQYGSDVTTDWLPGHPIRFRSAWEGSVYEQWGEIVEVVTHQRIKYTLFAPSPDREDVPENYFAMTYELVEGPEGATVLRFVHEDPKDVEGQAADASVEEDESEILLALKAVVESTH